MSFVIGLVIAHCLVQDPSAAAGPTPQKSPTGARDLPLRALVIAALQHNLTLRTARATTSSIETDVQSARGTFDPFVEASSTLAEGDRRLLAQPGLIFSGNERSAQILGGLSGTLPWSTSYSVLLDANRRRLDNPDLLAPGELSPLANTSLSFTLTQPLLRGFGPGIAQAPVRQAEFSAQSARARLGRLMEQTIAEVESAYWTLGLAKAIERISRDSYDRARDLLSRNERLLKLNLISEVDAITSRRGVQQRLTTLIEAVRRRKDSAEQLIFLVYGESAHQQLDPDLDFATELPPEKAPALADLASLERTALQDRDDVRAARFDVNQSEVANRVARNALLPDARLSASYATQALGTEDFQLFSVRRPGDLETGDWRLGVNLSYPLWNRTARAANARAEYELQASQATVASFEQQVRSDVRSAVRAISTNIERLEQARLGSDYARQQYAGGQKQLQLGLLDSFRLLQMEEEVSSAELVFEQTRYDLALAITAFEVAMGTNTRRKYGAAASDRRP